MNMADDVEFQIAKLSLGADDILVLRTLRPTTSVIAAELTARLERKLSLPGRILVVDPGIELSVMARPDVKPAGKATPAKA